MATRERVETALRLLIAGCRDPQGYRVPFEERIEAYHKALQEIPNVILDEVVRNVLQTEEYIPSAKALYETCRATQVYYEVLVMREQREERRKLKPALPEEKRALLAREFETLVQKLRRRP